MTGKTHKNSERSGARPARPPLLGTRLQGVARLIAGFASGAMAFTGAAWAEGTAYGCPQTIVRGADVYVQGSDGVFFRQKPDLDVYFPLSDHFAARVGEFSRILAARGTTLIVVPIPARGTAMALHVENLPPDATMAFDSALAKTSYEGLVRKLRDQDVKVVDLLGTLQSKPDGTDFFQPVDHHWNAAGSEAAAHAVADFINPITESQKIPRTEFQTTPLGERAVTSKMRHDVQLFCSGAIPPNLVKVTETVAKLPTEQGQAIDIFGDAAEAAQIGLAGTSFSDVDALNFAGFLSQFTGLDVTNVAISGGNQFTSILSYVTSPGFAKSPPKFLLWENPAYNNLGELGDQPFDELVAAGSGSCESDTAGPLPLRIEGDTLQASLPPDFRKRATYYLFDIGDSSVRGISGEVAYDSGRSIPIDMKRNDRFKSSGRFYFKTEPGAASISLGFAGLKKTDKATLTACGLKAN